MEESLQLEAEGPAGSYPSDTNLQMISSDRNIGSDQNECLIQFPDGGHLTMNSKVMRICRTAVLV